MYCAKCGKADQSSESFCRSCGTYLHDPSKPYKREQPPEEHLKANTVLSALTILTSFTLAALLYIFVAFRLETPILVYVTAGFLIAIGGWHIQTLIRTIKLRNQLKKWGRLGGEKQEKLAGRTREDQKSLQTADLDLVVPASVTERTTRHLTESRKS